MAAMVAVMGCSRESGLRPVTRGSGLGEEWTFQGDPSSVMRVSVQNSFTRDVYVDLSASGATYQLIVGPIRERFMVIPKKDYDIKVRTNGPSSDPDYIHYYRSDTLKNGISGIFLRIRP